MVPRGGQQSALLDLAFVHDMQGKRVVSVLACAVPWFVEAAVINVGVERGPVLTVLGDLEDPVPQRRAAVAPAGQQHKILLG